MISGYIHAWLAMFNVFMTVGSVAGLLILLYSAMWWPFLIYDRIRFGIPIFNPSL